MPSKDRDSQPVSMNYEARHPHVYVGCSNAIVRDHLCARHEHVTAHGLCPDETNSPAENDYMQISIHFREARQTYQMYYVC